MSDERELQAQDKAVNETIHLLAHNYKALDDTVRRLLAPNEEQETLPLSFAPNAAGRNHSLYYMLNANLRTQSLAPRQVARILGLVLRELDRHGAVILNLLSSLNANEPLNVHRRAEDLQEILQEIVDVFEGSANEKGVELRLQVKGTPIVEVDRQLMYRAFLNVIDNAIKYSYQPTAKSPTRYVDVKCRRHTAEGAWLISVESYGVGIEPDEIDSGVLFEYGRRGRRASDRYRSGTGIGLSETKRIVLAHGGSIRIESRPLYIAYLTTVSITLGGRR